MRLLAAILITVCTGLSWPGGLAVLALLLVLTQPRRWRDRKQEFWPTVEFIGIGS
jgi:hypothetical protein